MSLQQLSGTIIIIGSILFLIAAFLPISMVYAAPSAAEKLALIEKSPRAWQVSQVLFASGAIFVVLGAVLSALALRERPWAITLVLAAGLLATGAAAWTWHVSLRAVNSLAWVNGQLPGWHFPIYTVLTILALILTGIALLKMGFPTWAGWTLIGGSVVFFTLYVVFKDLPPFVHYLLGLILGIVLIRKGS